MADFKPAYKFAMQWEGGYSNDPDDRGGETYKGVARNAHPNWEGWHIIDDVKSTRKLKRNDLIKNSALDRLHYEYAKHIFWDEPGINKINNQAVANVIFDWFWGSGYIGLTGALKVANAMAKNKVKKWGASAIDLINSIDPDVYLSNLFKVRKDFLLAVVKKKPTQQKFLKGWLNRLNDLAASVGTKIKDVVTANPVSFGLGSALALAAIAAGVYTYSKRR